MAAHPTRRDRNWRQKLKARYMMAREDAQRFGLIPTTPEGAVRNERVDPVTQGEQALPALVRLAVCRGWAVPDAKKPELVDELIRVVTDPDSTELEKIASFRALFTADHRQWERDNADLANKVNGGGDTNVVTYEQAHALLQQVEQQTGTKFMCPSMREIEDAAKVLPEELIPES